MGDFGSNDQILSEQAESLVLIGDLDGAKRIAAQLTDRQLLHGLWHSILYRQFDSGDLQQVKETIGSLSDEFLWMGSWVHDLVLNLAKSGDTDGAMWIVNKMPGDSPRGHFLMLIASVQAEKDDCVGTEHTLELLQGNKFWRDGALAQVARIRKMRGDTDGAHRIATMINDPIIRDVAFRHISASSTQSDT